MQKLLRSFSYIFHPLFVPVYVTVFYFFIARNFFYQNEIYLVFVQVLILTVLLPISLYYLLRSLGLIKSKIMLDKKERRLPLAFYAVLLFMLIKHSFSTFMIPELSSYFTGVLVSTLIALALVLLNFKASLHMMAASSLTVFIVGISVYYHIQLLSTIAFLIICLGFVASSRLQAKAHTLSELALGSFIGIVPQIAMWYFWLLPSL